MAIWMKNDMIAPSKMKVQGGKLFGVTEKQLEEMGFEEVEETLPAAPAEEIIPRTIFTKLEIRRALRRLGLEERLDEILDSNPQLKHDWTDAQEIDINDEGLQEAMQNGFISRELFDEVVEALRA